MRRHQPEPPPLRRRVERTPAQLAREVEIGVEIAEFARAAYGHRFAPDGTPLSRYPGTTWTERRAAWGNR